MRCWHYKIIPYLAKSQLVSQWRELNSIYKKQDDHLLINYIYDYPKIYLYAYSQIVINELKRRNYKIKKWDNYNEYFDQDYSDIDLESYIFKEHDDEYIVMNYWNLKEKYIRGQKDFSKEIWNKIDEKFGGLINEIKK